MIYLEINEQFKRKNSQTNNEYMAFKQYFMANLYYLLHVTVARVCI